MITSVSTLSPYLKTVPWTFMVDSLDFAGIGDLAGDGAGGGDGGRGEVDFARLGAHAADEVAVRGGDAAFAGGEDAHVAAEARAAGRRGDDAAGFGEGLQVAFLHRLQPDALGGGDDDRADAGGDLASLEDRGGGGEVREASVRAGPDHHLVDLHGAGLRDRARVGWEVRECGGGR